MSSSNGPDFDARIGIVDRRPHVQRAFDSTLLGG
jgi:hypothetical protein